MKTYDPEAGPLAAEWLAIDEAERISLVESYHRRCGIQLSQLTLHATIHVVVENQIALGEALVIDAVTFSSDQGEPPHIHVARHRKSAKFWLEPVRLECNLGFAPKRTEQGVGVGAGTPSRTVETMA